MGVNIKKSVHEKMTLICNEIRRITNSSKKLDLDAIAEELKEITSVTNTGPIYDRGYADGHNAGAFDERSKTWDMLQNYGKVTQYNYAFFRRALDNFYPKYDIKPTNADYMFRDTLGETTVEPFDLAARLEECGVSMDFSQCTAGYYIFYSTPFTRLPVIDLSNLNALTMTFRSNPHLHTIDKVILKNDGSQSVNNPFTDCKELVNIIIEGVIGQNGFNFGYSTKLSHDSIVSVINALSSATTGLSIVLSLSSVMSAFETAEGLNDGNTSAEWSALVATKPNWTISIV